MTALLVIIAVVLLIASAVLHFNKHFTLRSFIICTPPDGQELDFFPYSFQIYLMLEIFICIILITRMIITNDSTNKYKSISDNSFMELNHIDEIYDFDSFNPSIVNIINCILVYFVLIISLFESLFTWYRFYTTYITSITLSDIETIEVFKKYSLYAVIFTLLYILTFNVYYWIFPSLILLHCIFNFYCNQCFASMLIKTYSEFITLSRNFLNIHTDAANQQVLDAVYYMRKVSMTCTIIQSIYLCLFIIIYYINIDLIVIYIPILWSISSFIFALNFARNRSFMQNLSIKVIKLKSKSVSCAKQIVIAFQFKNNDTEPSVAISTLADQHMTPSSPTRSADPETVKTPILKDHVHPNYKLTINLKKHTDPVMTDNTSNEIDDETPFPNTNANNTPKSNSEDASDPIKDKPKSNLVKKLRLQINDSLQFSNKNPSEHPPTPGSIPGLLDFITTPSKDGLNVSSGKFSSKMSHLSPIPFRDNDSIEYTRNHSAFDMSVYTEMDLDGTKQQEFDRYIRVNAAPREHIDDETFPDEILNIPHNSSMASKIVMVNYNNEENKFTENENTDNSTHLDTIELFARLSLLKKFGLSEI